MSRFDEFLSKLPPAVKRNIHTAENIETVQYETCSTGLNWALNGGIGAGRMTLLYGDSGAGKSLLMLLCIAKWQREGKVCAYVDSEGTVTAEFARKMGVNTDELIYIDQKVFGRATNEIMPLIRAGVDILAVDTYSDLLPDVYTEKDGTVKEFDGNKQIGAHAVATKIMINMIMTEIQPNTAVIMMSQSSTDISGMHPVLIPAGGKKIQYKVSQMIELKTSRFDSQQFKESIDIGYTSIQASMGRRIKATVKKNKFGPEMRTAEWNMYYEGPNIGIDFDEETMTLAIQFGVVVKSGSWLKWKDFTIQGKEDMIAAIQEKGLWDQFKAETRTGMTGVIEENVE